MLVEVNVYLFDARRSAAIAGNKTHFLLQRLSVYLDGKSSMVEILWHERDLSYESIVDFAEETNVSLVYCVS